MHFTAAMDATHMQLRKLMLASCQPFQNRSHSDLEAVIEALVSAERMICIGFCTRAMVADCATWLLGKLRDKVSVSRPHL